MSSTHQGYRWKQYNLHKRAASRHFQDGQKAEQIGNYHLAYLCYNKAIDARLHADSLWSQLQGPHTVDAGHCQFTFELIRQYRDRVQTGIQQTKSCPCRIPGQ